MNGPLAIHFHLSRNCLYCQSSLTSAILPHIRLGRLAAGGEDFQSHVAAGFGPFIVLLGQHRADQADDRVAAGEDADHVGSGPSMSTAARGSTGCRSARDETGPRRPSLRPAAFDGYGESPCAAQARPWAIFNCATFEFMTMRLVRLEARPGAQARARLNWAAVSRVIAVASTAVVMRVQPASR